MTSRRLNVGGFVDREQPLDFFWNGVRLKGFSGDTLASALLANGKSVIGRSFKYHRPRGVMSAGVEESGALVTLGAGDRSDANVRATTQELYQGLIAKGQNAWPSVEFDLGAINNLLGRFFAAGFYYKTFMGIPPFEWGSGTGAWMWYEKFIRKAAGMGRASRLPDPDNYEHAHDYCDVLVVGSGPTGEAAAISIADAGLDVILVEQDSSLGGNSLVLDESLSSDERLAYLKSKGVRVMSRTTAFGIYDNLVVGLLERVSDHISDPPAYLPRQRFWIFRSRFIILATGAIERHIAFSNNDRPGVMTANAGCIYLKRFGVLVGEQVTMATTNDSAYQVAADLNKAGASVTLLDARPQISSELTDIIQSSGIELHLSAAPFDVIGRSATRGLTIAKSDGSHWKKAFEKKCDSILVSGGWSPVIHLLSHRGVKPIWHPTDACFLPGATDESIVVAGAAAGVWDNVDCRESGERVAEVAIRTIKNGLSSESVAATMGNSGTKSSVIPLYEVRNSKKKFKSFVDFQHDVTSNDIRLAHKEGYVSVEHLKRYTTLGMATDGGKMGNVVGLALMAEAAGKEIPDVGTTVFRPPYTPVSIGALAGRSVGKNFRPLRKTALHDWNIAHGAVMIETGLWQRPWYYPQAGETISEAYVREATITRRSVGICDVTSLGKIAVQGPDATEFLDRIYTNAFAKLAVGKARYGIMLRDDGLVMDDGTTWRLSETDYFMTTTTAHAAQVMAWLEELLQTRWPSLKVHVTSVSDAWVGISVSGPKSRAVLESVSSNVDHLSNESFPFMGVREVFLKDGVECRVARISFSGELGYEVYVPADFGSHVMEKLWVKAAELGGCLYGLETLGTLRIEKGHVTGAELDGRVTLEDAGLGKMASSKKLFIGSTLRRRPELLRQDRPKLVGIFPRDRTTMFNAGAILKGADSAEECGDGWITAVTHSPELGHWIGLGFISGGHSAWTNKGVVSLDPVRNRNIDVEIVSPHMVDPEGVRQRG
ncbi:MAG: sarcosine oxidase subunit alpha [Chloroflexi bacterium]|nr:sarcosine oxidase subunit alpha [Chloroflexota bacterium]|tara:strand:- start:5796 stop:8786 length:2991 start_codon:yes stop_codon:yes gene_type:complete